MKIVQFLYRMLLLDNKLDTGIGGGGGGVVVVIIIIGCNRGSKSSSTHGDNKKRRKFLVFSLFWKQNKGRGMRELLLIITNHWRKWLDALFFFFFSAVARQLVQSTSLWLDVLRLLWPRRERSRMVELLQRLHPSSTQKGPFGYAQFTYR